MNRFAWTMALAVALAAGAATAPAADDGKKSERPGRPARPEKPDWSKYATAGDVSGTVLAADDEGVTLRVSAAVARIYRNRIGPVREQHADFELKFADAGLARWKKLPPRVGADGNKVPYTPSETQALRLPNGAPGYAAERSDLAGKIVEAQLVRPRSVPAATATVEDLVIKYAVIVGTDAAATKAAKGAKGTKK